MMVTGSAPLEGRRTYCDDPTLQPGSSCLAAVSPLVGRLTLRL